MSLWYLQQVVVVRELQIERFCETFIFAVFLELLYDLSSFLSIFNHFYIPLFFT